MVARPVAVHAVRASLATAVAKIPWRTDCEEKTEQAWKIDLNWTPVFRDLSNTDITESFDFHRVLDFTQLSHLDKF